ncbi:MAG TPA: tetratricopeptide repeat protein [Gemmatimonadaceae bacterium]
MADPAIGFERAFDKATYSPIPSAPGTPADRAGGGGESVDTARAELISLIKLGTTNQEAGNLADAEECFRRALETADRLFAPEDPDLIILLNDLSRLYLRQSAFSLAEPLLLRLLELKRSKGEDHPEVATVLASLASVRQALGMHESSEQLWLRVLDIRERTLAPNHFATASALEHLGDAFAARGKISEALSAFQRALTIRERTLGNEHPSLRVARERIADLQLQSSDDMLGSSVSDVASPPERYRLLPAGDPPSVKLSVSPPVGSTPPLKFTPQPPRTTTSPSDVRIVTREKKSSFVIPRSANVPAPATEIQEKADLPETIILPVPSIEPRGSGLEEEAAPQLTTATDAYRDALESVREAIEDGSEDEALAGRGNETLSTILAFIAKREVLVASAVVVGLGLVGTAVATGTRAWGEAGQPSAAVIPPLTNATPTASANPIPVPVSLAPASDVENNSKVAKPRPSEERNTSKKTPDKKPETPTRVAMPALSKAVLSGLDSVAARAAAVTGRTSESLNLQPAPTAFAARRPTFDEDHGNAPQRARLIGELPTPHVPAQVMDVEGEVRVRFNVDSLGRPVLESFAVVNSPNPLLTAAVRKVVPGMRFEPARTAGPDAKAIGDVVQIGFQFSRRE